MEDDSFDQFFNDWSGWINIHAEYEILLVESFEMWITQKLLINAACDQSWPLFIPSSNSDQNKYFILPRKMREAYKIFTVVLRRWVKIPADCPDGSSRSGRICNGMSRVRENHTCTPSQSVAVPASVLDRDGSACCSSWLLGRSSRSVRIVKTREHLSVHKSLNHLKYPLRYYEGEWKFRRIVLIETDDDDQ